MSKDQDLQRPARQKLIDAGLTLFANKGYDAASTREIAELAGVNISSIRYYFGDKAGLYRAVYTEPLKDLPGVADQDSYQGVSIEGALKRIYRDFLEPLKRGKEFQLVMRIHFREMIEPSGVWQEDIDAEIKPQHDLLVGLLCKRYGMPRPDADIHRLAFSMMGMAVHFYVGHEVVGKLAPSIVKDHKAIDTLAERLAGYGLAMVEAEANRRASIKKAEHP